MEFIIKEDAYSMTIVLGFFANCQLPIANYPSWFIYKEDAYSMTIVEVFLPIAYCLLPIIQVGL